MTQGLNRITLHWTAGSNQVSSVDREHYHYIIDGDGKVHPGDHEPEDNINVGDDDYAAHVLNANTGNIGVALAGMSGAIERPFKKGLFPLTAAQVASACNLVATLCQRYNIDVTPTTVLTHAEVEGTLGIKQKGKWDIMWLPDMPSAFPPREVGDILRKRILAAMASLTNPPAPIEYRLGKLEAWAREKGYAG